MLKLFQRKNSKASAEMSINALANNFQLAEFLDSLPFEYSEGYGCEMVTFKQISEKSIFVASVLQNISKTKLDDKTYHRRGHLLFRTYPTMPVPTEKKQFNFTYREIKP